MKEQETRLSLRDMRQLHITLQELSAVGQHKMHRFEPFAFEKYCDIETGLGSVKVIWNDTIR